MTFADDTLLSSSSYLCWTSIIIVQSVNPFTRHVYIIIIMPQYSWLEWFLLNILKSVLDEWVCDVFVPRCLKEGWYLSNVSLRNNNNNVYIFFPNITVHAKKRLKMFLKPSLFKLESKIITIPNIKAKTTKYRNFSLFLIFYQK